MVSFREALGCSNQVQRAFTFCLLVRDLPVTGSHHLPFLPVTGSITSEKPGRPSRGCCTGRTCLQAAPRRRFNSRLMVLAQESRRVASGSRLASFSGGPQRRHCSRVDGGRGCQNTEPASPRADGRHRVQTATEAPGSERVGREIRKVALISELLLLAGGLAL